MARLTEETKRNIIKLYNDGFKPKFMSKQFGKSIPLPTIYNLIKKYNKTGSLENIRTKRWRKISPDMEKYMEEYIDSNR